MNLDSIFDSTQGKTDALFINNPEPARNAFGIADAGGKKESDINILNPEVI